MVKNDAKYFGTMSMTLLIKLTKEQTAKKKNI